MSETVKTPSLAEVVSKRVRSLRERRGWSLSELARRAGIGVSTLSEIEAGQSAPRLDTLVALAHALGAPLETFLHADENPLEARLRAIETPENLSALQVGWNAADATWRLKRWSASKAYARLSTRFSHRAVCRTNLSG
jgi:Predicted transcription factor, homolog of eukaryotic MBF1